MEYKEIEKSLEELYKQLDAFGNDDISKIVSKIVSLEIEAEKFCNI